MYHARPQAAVTVAADTSRLQRRARLLAAVVVTLGVAAACAPPERSAPEHGVRIDEIFTQWNRPDSPGCAVSVTREGELLFARGYGSANLDHGIPNTADSVFHVASVSKQFTAAAIALLAIDGRLALDDDISQYLPELPDVGARITIRHLLHHTSGLRDQWELLILNGWRYSQDLVTDEDVLAVLQQQKSLNFAPGEQHLYSNSGYTLLAQIVERVSGMSLRQFTQARLFEPLGMHRTFFRDNFREIVSNQAYGYVATNDGFETSVTNFDTVGATSLLTTASDLAHWARNLETGEIGGPAFLEMMQQQGRLNDGSPVNYMLGLIPGRHRGLAVVEHSGSDAGYTAHFMHFPQERIAVACLCNTPTDPAGLARRVADVFLADAPQVAPTTNDGQADPVVVEPALRLKRAGLYRHAGSDQFLEIVTTDDRLDIHKWGMELPLQPLTKDRLQVGPYAVFLEFVATGEDGTAVALQFGDGDAVTYLRVDPAVLPPAELADYAGVYVSKEIAVPYQVDTGDQGALTLTWPRYADQPLRPAMRDTFFSNVAGTVRFSRDAGGSVDGFALVRERSRNLEFTKQ